VWPATRECTLGSIWRSVHIYAPHIGATPKYYTVVPRTRYRLNGHDRASDLIRNSQVPFFRECSFSIAERQLAGTSGAAAAKTPPIGCGEKASTNAWLTALTLSCTARAFVFGVVARRLPRFVLFQQQRVICSRRDTALVLFGPGASAPDRSRAVPASASSWAADEELVF
jgi:hypothetical protein